MKDSLPRRSFVEQRAHIVAALGPTLRPRQAVPVRAPSSAKQLRSCAVSRVNLESLPFGWFLWCFFVLSSVTESRADSAWFHVPMLVYFPGCTADTGWKFCSFPSPPPETFGVSLHLHGFHGCELLNLFRPLFHRPHVLDITFASWKAYGNDEVCLHMPFLECRWCLCSPCLILFQILLNFAFCLILQFNYIFISLHSFTIYDPYFIFESKSCKNLKE